MKKRITQIVIPFIFGIVLLLFIKNQYTSLLLSNATYGMPALIKKGSVDDLYMGSSMFRQGLDIELLEKYNNESYILAYNGNQPALEYLQLKNLIKQGVSIKKLYVDMYVYSAWEYPSIEDEKIFLEMDLPTKIELASMVYGKEYQFKPLWQMFVGSNNELLLVWPISNLLVNNQFRKGGTLLETQGKSESELGALMVPSISGEMNEIQKLYIKKMVNLAKENKIEIIFVETPKYTTIANNELYLSSMQQYAQVLNDLDVKYMVSTSTFNNFNDILKMNGYCYSFDISQSDMYIDNIHLSTKGREEFTEKLIKEFDNY